ncbi:MAG: nucleoside phosphorylase [Bacteroidales bacterium]|nr:nucleoside phosphorylase [Bacteroidales bacterium]
MKRIAESELVLNPDGSIYHIKLRPEHIAKDIIIVGDPGRVDRISRHFDKIEFKIQNREFITHTGSYKGNPITVLATGIGTDNIDIVINELDAIVNIDLEKREVKENHTSLNIVRLGTSGALQPDVPVDSVVLSTHGLGLDGMLNYYAQTNNIFDNEISEAFIKHTSWLDTLAYPYTVKGSEILAKKIDNNYHKGITATSPGFYGPQGRILRLGTALPDLNKYLGSFTFKGHRITNFEMETSALYGLAGLLGHNAVTVCAIIANRTIQQFSKDYKKTVDILIEQVLHNLFS